MLGLIIQANCWVFYCAQLRLARVPQQPAASMRQAQVIG
jgi:hypothetical protein